MGGTTAKGKAGYSRLNAALTYGAGHRVKSYLYACLLIERQLSPPL